jgi:hypothetical protein
VGFFVGVLVAMFGSGCSVVEKIGSDGAVERHVSFSPVTVIEVSPGSANVVQARGIGLGLGPNAAALGAYEITAASPDPECGILIMPDRSSGRQEISPALLEAGGACARKNR